MSDTSAPPLTIVEFLNARLDEDEAAARALEADDLPTVLSWVGISGEEVARVSRYLSTFERTRVLADIAAKGAVVSAYQAELTRMDPAPEGVIGRRALGWVVGRMASVYRDHPDYREEWKP